MRVACFQFDVRRGDVAHNLREVERGLRAAAEGGVSLVVLPEMWPTSFVDDGVPTEWVRLSAAAVARVAELTRELEVIACGSGFGAGEPGEKPRNRLHVLVDGERVLAYDKVHLFSPTAESEGFSAGRVPPPTITTRLGSLSGVVCYDVRFSGLLRTPYEEGAEILVVPAQWPRPRESHWRALILGRAVEHQSFLVAANRTGTDHVGRRRMELVFPGNSIVAGPDGTALAEGAGESGLVVADIDLGTLRRLRARVPVRKDERPASYRSSETP